MRFDPFANSSIAICRPRHSGATPGNFRGRHSRCGAGKESSFDGTTNSRITGFLIPQAFDAHLHGTHHGEPPTKTVVHLHGAVVRPTATVGRMPGSPRGSAGAEPNGQARSTNIPIEQDACTLWYHDHAIGQTRLNVYAGLAGAYIIRDDEEDALGLPSGENEMLLIIQDRSFAADGSLTYPVSDIAGTTDHPGPWVPEFFGDTILVNGKVWPYLEVEPRKYRLRILNGSNARFYRLRLSDGRPFVQIGTDQGLLPAPVEVRRLLLAPAERADVIVDFRGARGQADPAHERRADAISEGQASGPAHGADVMEFRVNRPLKPARIANDSRQIAHRLSRCRKDATVRHMAFREYKDAKGEPITVLLNGRKWDAPITIRPKLGDTEVWHLINTTDDAHPIHLHLVRFQVLDRQAFNVDAYLEQWGAEKVQEKAPIRLRSRPICAASAKCRRRKNADGRTPCAPIRARSSVSLPASTGYAGKYPWHCHMLEHEDNEMMLQFEVMP